MFLFLPFYKYVHGYEGVGHSSHSIICHRHLEESSKGWGKVHNGQPLPPPHWVAEDTHFRFKISYITGHLLQNVVLAAGGA